MLWHCLLLFAFRAPQTTHLPNLKLEFPTLKHSQLKERIFEMWKKAPENPDNQAK